MYVQVNAKRNCAYPSAPSSPSSVSVHCARPAQIRLCNQCSLLRLSLVRRAIWNERSERFNMRASAGWLGFSLNSEQEERWQGDVQKESGVTKCDVDLLCGSAAQRYKAIRFVNILAHPFNALSSKPPSWTGVIIISKCLLCNLQDLQDEMSKCKCAVCIAFHQGKRGGQLKRVKNGSF
mmetsp:Transcript_42116/g.108410  ORF Transcript_42116/g.108410 Transcript_42116/m.108410 type:complete len:179 (+) Transcript_42116:750-1286(+)